MAVAAQAEISTDRAWFRGDVDGLRAVAIVLVVAFHAGVPGFAGGFIGVDVFFVISGYLITTKLTSEVDSSGRVRLATFWANRAKRLVPAMALMVTVTFVLSALVLSPLEIAQLPVQGGSAILYVSNIVFARADTSYFAETDLVSPFLHTWSLSVEEQFYLVWPVLIALTAVVRRGRRWSRRGLAVVLAVGSVASMGLNLLLTRVDSRWAFYSLPTRAWEFGVAGLLAIVVVPAALRGRSVQIAAAVGGVALLAYGTVGFNRYVGYPGLRALVPVTATLLLIVAGTSSGATPLWTTTVLSTAPMQWIGRVSYSWYLWHWPFMVLAAALLDTEAVGVRVVAGLVALPVAAAVYAWFERPIRFSPRLSRSPRRAFGVAGAISAVALLSAVAFAGYASVARGGEPYATLLAVKADYRDYPCEAVETSPAGISYCVNGKVDGSRTLMVIGDSHAQMWQTAFGEVAAGADTRLITRWLGGCPSVPVTLRPSASSRVQRPCREFQAETVALIEELEPEAVVISNADRYLPEITSVSGTDLGDSEAAAAWADGYRELAGAIRSTSAQVGRISDNPVMGADPLICVSRPGNSEVSCGRDRDGALASTARLRDAEETVVDDLGGVPTLETVDQICEEGWCSVERDGVYVFADPDHLTKAWTRTQVGRIEELFGELGLT